MERRGRWIRNIPLRTNSLPSLETYPTVSDSSSLRGDARPLLRIEQSRYQTDSGFGISFKRQHTGLTE